MNRLFRSMVWPCYLQSIYRDPTQEQHVRMRAARDAIAYESPKLIATALIDGRDFATRLERAVARSRRESAKVIEAEPKPRLLPASPYGFKRRV